MDIRRKQQTIYIQAITMEPKKPPKYRRLYEKISVDADVIAELERVKAQLHQNNPENPQPSYNKAIHYLIENQQL